MQKIKLGTFDVSRFILGGNPFSGFSHNTPEIDKRMTHYFTTSQVKRMLKEAESLGVNTMLARADRHIMRLVMEYHDEGGKIQWIAQSCPELVEIERSVKNAADGGAIACYIHGGVMDLLLAQNRLAEVPPVMEAIRAAGMAAGVAGHNPEVHRWANKELDIDFHMCSYYDASPRTQSAELKAGMHENWRDSDRDIMVETIAALSRPAIHYKVLAAGRNNPAESFEFVAKHLRPADAVCVGIYDENHPNMLQEDIELFERSLK